MPVTARIEVEAVFQTLRKVAYQNIHKMCARGKATTLEIRWMGIIGRPQPQLHLPSFHSATVVAVTMPQTSPDIPSRANYQLIFDSALQAYKKKTGEDLPSTPLFRTLETCHSSDDVIATLRQQIPAFDQSGSSDDRLTRWLDPTVKVVNAFSATIGGAVALVSLIEYGMIHPESSRRSSFCSHTHLVGLSSQE